MKPELSIVMPCFNECGNIPRLAERLARFYAAPGNPGTRGGSLIGGPPLIDFELVLVDNGSTDDSREALRLAGEKYKFIKPVFIEKNIGYGHGIFTGLLACAADILAYTHGDIQTPPEDVIKAYHLYRKYSGKGEKIIVKGFRTGRPPGQVFLTNALSTTVKYTLGYDLPDINGQPKLFPRTLFELLAAPPPGFFF